MRRNDFCVDVLIADVRVQLIRRAQRCEYREGGRERHETRSCHTCRDAEHILLCNTDVKHAVGAGVCEVLQFGRGGKVSGDRHNLFMFFGKVSKGLAVDFRGGKLRGFNYVINKSSGHYSNSFPQRAMRSAL